jgi:broad specificity phosphatase PhoE
MLIVVRHGRTESNASGLLLGRSDPSLDDIGRAQADALASELSGAGADDPGAGPDLRTGPVRVVSSPLVRARQTAESIAARCGVTEVEVDDRWIELDYGELDGTPMADVPAEVWSRWRSDPDFAPVGGETLRSLRARVDEACEHWSGIAAGAGGGDVVIVSHVSPIKASVGWALGLDEQVNWRTFVAPASITRISGGPTHPVLRSFNETSHLTV